MTAYRISDAAQRARLSASALRFYESSGLVPDAARTPAGYRMYDEAAIERLRFVHRARNLGLSLQEIRELVGIWDAGSCAPVQHDLAVQVAARRARVESRIAELQTLSDQLRDTERAVLAAPGDGRCGAGCACLAGPVVESPDGDTNLGGSTLVGLSLLRARPDADGGFDNDELPVACTLTAEQIPARLRAWQELVATAVDRLPVPHGQRLVFAPAAGLAARIAELCELEQGCCAFFTFTLTVAYPGNLTLDITAPEHARPLIDALLDSAS